MPEAPTGTRDPRPYTITGGLSDRPIVVPDLDAGPMPDLAQPGVIQDGLPPEGFGDISGWTGYSDVRSYHRKLGLLIPATNTTMEHELWSLLRSGHGHAQLAGVGLHATTVATPKPRFGNDTELLAYMRQFVDGLGAAVDQALLAQPHYMLMGMSLEHILRGLDGIREVMSDVEERAQLSCAAWHDAAAAALSALGATRIGLLTPFDRVGNENATTMFAELGFDVVTTVGFSCAHALHVAHIPEWAKEKAIVELLAPHNLDAIVQCGTNMSFSDLAERLEPRLDIPLVGINAALLWYALRENGITAAIGGAGTLLRAH